MTPEELDALKRGHGFDDRWPVIDTHPEQLRCRCGLRYERGGQCAVLALVAEVERLREVVIRLLETPDYSPEVGRAYAYDAHSEDFACVWCGEKPSEPHEADCPYRAAMVALGTPLPGDAPVAVDLEPYEETLRHQRRLVFPEDS